MTGSGKKSPAALVSSLQNRRQKRNARPQETVPTTSAQEKTPSRPAKRRYHAVHSPQAKSESSTPHSKRPVHQSPLPYTLEIVAVLQNSGRSRSLSCSGSFASSNLLAMPRVSAEPPCPSSLPKPPSHWVDFELQGASKRRHCRDATNHLITHLQSSGILVCAQ